MPQPTLPRPIAVAVPRHDSPRRSRRSAAPFVVTLLAAALVAGLAATRADAGIWPSWRGPLQTGVAPDAEGLVATWSRDGQNLAWRADFTGRSTPVVFDGRVCAQGRAGEGDMRQETLACWHAGSGELLWERRFPVVNTDVPWNRVGWSAPVADPETGNLYAQLVDGKLIALDRDGELVWRWFLANDLGRFSGYGGRTNTPTLDGDRLIVHLINSGFGSARGPADRLYAFDKRTGEVLWVSPRGGPPQDLNTYSTPIVTDLGDRRAVIYGGSDGILHAYDVRTGEELWSFRLSQRGLNVSPVAHDGVVYAGHSEENLGTATMGRLVAIDASGRGDVTATHEKWRIEGLGVGYASPALHDGTLYVIDNSANLHAVDAATGTVRWEHSLGTVGKGSPVIADGKLYATEVNGNVHILGLGDDGPKVLDSEHLRMPDEDRYAEVYASPAIGYGRVYFTTEEGIYALGDPAKPFRLDQAKAPTTAEARAPAGATAATLRVVPAVVSGRAGEPVRFRAEAFDAQGRPIGPVTATWKVEGLPGTIAADGTLTTDPAAFDGSHVGTVTASAGELVASADVRLAGPLPWREDFEALEVGKVPPGWLGTGKKAAVIEMDGSKVLRQPDPQRGAPRTDLLLGPSYLSGYTIQADVHGSQQGRRRPDVGLLDQGYILDLQGNHQRLQITSWTSELRPLARVPYEWTMDRWYTLKLRVDLVDDAAGGQKTVIRGKVWPRDEAEPADWTITLEDPQVIGNGAPGLYAFSPVDAFFDNVSVTPSAPLPVAAP